MEQLLFRPAVAQVVWYILYAQGQIVRALARVKQVQFLQDLHKVLIELEPQMQMVV